MITKITIDKVASFQHPASIDINKKFVLLYGLNGTGKTTISNYLYHLSEKKYKDCKIEGYNPNDTDILVYNQQFIQDNFSDPKINGIFTLSKENKEAEKEIAKLQKLKEDKKQEQTAKQNEKTEKKKEAENLKTGIFDITWKIKTDYEHDPEFKFCLEGLKGKKENIFTKLIKLPYVEDEKIDIETLRQKAQSVSDDAQKVEEIEEIRFSAHDIETSELFAKQIVGNTNSSVSTFIEQFNNSDWLKTGFEKHIEHHPENETCPFCHQKTITENWKENIKNYFDESYQTDINSLKDLQKKYEQNIRDIPQLSTFTENIFFKKYEKDFELHYNKFCQILTNNEKIIKDKIQNPSNAVNLENSTSEFNELNKIIQEINQEITQHNKNIDNKNNVRKEIKTNFWKSMRHQYKEYIESYQKQETELNAKINTLDTQINQIISSISDYNSQIVEQQENTINIEKAVTCINHNLQEIEITNFFIKKYNKDKKDEKDEKDEKYYFYYIQRDGENATGDEEFKTLSEGEKMLISFLYFIEKCKGKNQADQIEKKKIIVIDDPVSSLSHNHVFNIAQFIKREFYSKTYQQVFLLTHNLYFLDELQKIIKLENSIQRIRITKGQNGSSLCFMKKNEIRNDYQAYWDIIKNTDVDPAVLANSMRNILEYFFGFLKRKELKDIFKQEEWENDVKYSSFFRYTNRESHFDMKNAFDMKDFNHDDWMQCFQDVFEKTGNKEHYEAFMNEAIG